MKYSILAAFLLLCACSSIDSKMIALEQEEQLLQARYDKVRVLCDTTTNIIIWQAAFRELITLDHKIEDVNDEWERLYEQKFPQGNIKKKI